MPPRRPDWGKGPRTDGTSQRRFQIQQYWLDGLHLASEEEIGEGPDVDGFVVGVVLGVDGAEEGGVVGSCSSS